MATRKQVYSLSDGQPMRKRDRHQKDNVQTKSYSREIGHCHKVLYQSDFPEAMTLFQVTYIL